MKILKARTVQYGHFYSCNTVYDMVKTQVSTMLKFCRIFDEVNRNHLDNNKDNYPDHRFHQHSRAGAWERHIMSHWYAFIYLTFFFY